MLNYQKIINDPALLSPYKSRELVTLNCVQCQVEHQRKKHDIQIALSQNIKLNFCSRLCIKLHQSENTPSIKITLECSNCDTKFDRVPSHIHNGNNFCSKQCSSKFNGRLRLKNKSALCKGCNIPFRYKKTTTNTYCSLKCQRDFEFLNITIPRIENGEVWVSNTLKRYLTHTRGYKCEGVDCGLSDWKEKPISLHCDHIDGNSDNNFPSNLRLLCPNCHSQTETFGSRNKKNSNRATYTQRYRKRKLTS